MSVQWNSYLTIGVPPRALPIVCKAAVAWSSNAPLKIEVIYRYIIISILSSIMNLL